jgi:dTDP-4-amino-4,6-dideoxygalactose transaminase
MRSLPGRIVAGALGIEIIGWASQERNKLAVNAIELQCREGGYMASVRFVETKSVDWPRLQELLAASETANHWANFGPVSRSFEAAVERLLELPESLAVVATSSGTAAQFALTGVFASHAGRPLRWLASAFGFASSRIGPIADTVRLIDCDELGLIDLEAAAAMPPAGWDGLLVTNVFGRCSNLDSFVDFCGQRGKSLLVDNAQALIGLNRSSPSSPSEFISFHHTKPWGFGEGGCAILPREDVDLCRRLLDFGYGSPDCASSFAANGKLSDVAAAAILSRLETFVRLTPRYQEQWHRLAEIAEDSGFRVFSRLPQNGVLGFVPLQAPHPVDVTTIRRSQLPLAKYYRPLAEGPRARQIYDHMVCLAAHPGMIDLTDDYIHNQLRALVGVEASRLR